MYYEEHPRMNYSVYCIVCHGPLSHDEATCRELYMCCTANDMICRRCMIQIAHKNHGGFTYVVYGNCRRCSKPYSTCTIMDVEMRFRQFQAECRLRELRETTRPSVKIGPCYRFQDEAYYPHVPEGRYTSGMPYFEHPPQVYDSYRPPEVEGQQYLSSQSSYQNERFFKQYSQREFQGAGRDIEKASFQSRSNEVMVEKGHVRQLLPQNYQPMSQQLYRSQVMFHHPEEPQMKPPSPIFQRQHQYEEEGKHSMERTKESYRQRPVEPSMRPKSANPVVRSDAQIKQYQREQYRESSFGKRFE